MSWVWQAISHFLHQISRPELPPLGEPGADVNDRVSEQLTQESHFCLLQAAAAEEPHPQRHTRPLNPENSSQSTASKRPLWNEDTPVQAHACECTYAHERADKHMHTMPPRETQTTVPTDPAALKPSSVPHCWSTPAILLPGCAPAPPPSSLPALPWVNRNLCFLSTLPCLCGNPGDAVVQRMMQV